MEGARTGEVSLYEYGAILWRRKWLIAVVTLLGISLSIAYTKAKTPIYVSSAEVLVQPVTTDPFSGSVRTDQLLNLDTERELVTSAAVAEGAAASIPGSVSAQKLTKHVSVDIPPNSQILVIHFSDPVPARAADGAQAFAKAYLAFKQGQAVDMATGVAKTIQSKLDPLDDQAQTQSTIIANSPVGTAEHQNAERQLSQLTAQINVLHEQLANLATLDINPGQIIAPAVVPSSPASPRPLLNVLAGAFIGFFIGAILAFIFDRLDDRIRDVVGLEDAVDAPVIAIIPKTSGSRQRKGRVAALFDPGGPTAEAYKTLRTTLLAMSGQRGFKSLVVVSANPGEGKSVTAANVAVTLAESGKRVVLISADLRAPGIDQLFDLASVPGLAQVLAGKLEAVEALVQAPVDNLRILPSGQGNRESVELLGSEPMRRTIRELEAEGDFVVIDTPALLPVADALGIARLVGTTLFVARVGRTRGASVRRACRQLDRVGATTIGAVLCGLHVSSKDYGYGVYAQPGERDTAKKAGRGQTPSALRDASGWST